jgi:integrase/recombinase XerD
MQMIKATKSSTAKTAIVLDTRRIKSHKKFPVKLRVTFERKQNYYSTPFDLSTAEFEKIMYGKRVSEKEKNLKQSILEFETKAIEILQQIPYFTWSIFENFYYSNRLPKGNVEAAFNEYITELKSESRLGTADSYKCAMKSIYSFSPNLKFVEINKEFLTKYEKWMIENSKSKTTVGIYLRSLRTLFNKQGIDKSLYPFGNNKEKYSIPTSRNIKKALTLVEIKKIFDYAATPKSTKEMAKDYWIFIYLCNGLNVKDFCLLKRKNIDDDILNYVRAKTQRSKNNSERITVSLKSQAKEIIQKWGQPSINSESYVFPHLVNGMTPEQERSIIKQLIKTINKYMKQIASEIGINKEVTTYYARHSFASVLKRSGVSIEFISEALGHSDLKTTKSYLAGFESETIHKTTEALTAFTN